MSLYKGVTFAPLLYIGYWVCFCFIWKDSSVLRRLVSGRPETKEEFLERLNQIKCSHSLEIKYMIEGWELNQDTIKTEENDNGI